MAYQDPSQVDSPRGRWRLLRVLWNSRVEGSGDGGASLALGTWDGEPCLALRWNGDRGEGVGSPQSRGLPTWFIVPRELSDALLTLDDLAPEATETAQRLFDLYDGI